MRWHPTLGGTLCEVQIHVPVHTRHHHACMHSVMLIDWDWLTGHIDRDFLLLSVDRYSSVKPRPAVMIVVNSVCLQVEKNG